MKEKTSKPLWGVSDKGVIYTPSGYAVLWLPRFLAYRLQAWINKI